MALGYATKRKAEAVEPPKKPQTAFFIFSQDKRKSLVNLAKFKTSEGKQDTKEITKELGRLWASLDDKEKEKYTDKAKVLKKKYDDDMSKFKEENPDYRAPKKQKKNAKGKKSKKEKDPKAPKRSPSGYQIFCNEKREEVSKKDEVKRSDTGKLDVTKVMKILSKMWKDLSDKQKEPYLEQAQKLKEEYIEAKEKYEDDKAGESESDSEEEESD